MSIVHIPHLPSFVTKTLGGIAYSQSKDALTAQTPFSKEPKPMDVLATFYKTPNRKSEVCFKVVEGVTPEQLLGSFKMQNIRLVTV